MKPLILVVEDDPAVAEMVKTLLDAEGYPVREASGSEEALEHLAATEFPIVISDIFLDEHSGLDILRRARAFNSRCAVILITGKGSFETVLEATREGAFDYISKPFSLERMVQAVRNAEAALAQSAASAADASVGLPDGSGDASSTSLIGNSPAMVEVYKFVSRVAEADTTVLLEGETGTGKELVARMIHESSPRRKGRFAVVDCGALAGTLLETELFGAVRGAYTGADRDRMGMLESADGGTV
ncbi:MAG: sigma 54-interacting transcriptional regulator, partial [Acidobacteriota bacterium]